MAERALNHTIVVAIILLAMSVDVAEEVGMRKTVNAMKARGNLGQILEEVYYRGDQYIIERAGKAMAAVVPVEQYQQWQREREAFFAVVDEVKSRNRGRRVEETSRDVSVARKAARKRR